MTPKRPSFTQEEVLAFHSQGKPGKIEINATKPMATQRDLSLAYSPGVAVPVRVIAERPDAAYDYTLVKETAGWRIAAVLRHAPKRSDKI